MDDSDQFSSGKFKQLEAEIGGSHRESYTTKTLCMIRGNNSDDNSMSNSDKVSLACSIERLIYLRLKSSVQRSLFVPISSPPQGLRMSVVNIV